MKLKVKDLDFTMLKSQMVNEQQLIHLYPKVCHAE